MKSLNPEMYEEFLDLFKSILLSYVFNKFEKL
jgi:hypothetical protein